MKNSTVGFIVCLAVLTGFSAKYRTLDLEYGFGVKVAGEEDFDDYKTYARFELTKDNATIYADSLSEYEFGDRLYPLIQKTGGDSYELLFEINNRPSRNYLKRLFVKNGRVAGEDKLPTFIAAAKIIDGVAVYAGYWDDAQVWGENDNLTAYNPILYYSITPVGLKLDSALTVKKNIGIYGEFHGFSFDERTPVPVSVISRFDREIEDLMR